MEQTWLWIGFNVFVLVMLAVDLFVFHKDAHEVRVREAAAWSVVWVTLALLFGGGVYAFMGGEMARPVLRRRGEQSILRWRCRRMSTRAPWTGGWYSPMAAWGSPNHA
jgi:hypothetical protein